MTEQAEKSDGLDIVSIGNLYDGVWEKKYWSSSRGKDRHPYPVGYVAHRNNNGNTYKMAILEGLKGPEFVINSTDGQSCSGQTPDIAWEGFQKKSCIRIKFWRGKRFSCKIDGAELFGFKNPHVMRLLRGLKANVSHNTEPSLPSTSFGSGESKGTHELNTRSPVYSAETCKSTDLQVDLVKTQVKGKRSKKRKETHVKSVSEDEHKRGRPQDHTQRDDGPDCRQNCEGNYNKEIPSSSSDINENNTGLEKMAYSGNNTHHVTSAKDGLQLDSSISSEQHEIEKRLSVREASDFISSEDLKFIESDINLLKNQEHLDVLMSNHTPGLTSSKAVDDKGDPPVQKDSQLLDNLDLYAPDTMDPFVDSEIPKESTYTINEKLNSAQNSTCIVKDKIHSPGISVSEKCVTESQLKDEMVIADNSERSDSDPAGQEIDKSMMALLLPQAFPLLKTFTRKKKPKKMNLQEERKETDHGRKDQPPAKSSEQIQGEKLGGEVHVPDKVFSKNFKSVKQNENVLFSSTCMSSAIPSSEELATVAPDSFEDDQCEVKECSQAGQVQGAFETGPSTLGTGATLDAKTTSAVKHPVYRRKRSATERKRGATEVVGSGNASAKPIVDHVAQKGISGLKGGDGDANVSFMPICRDPRGDLVAELCSTSNVSAVDHSPAKSSEQIQGEKLGGEVHVPDKVYTENFKSEKQNENVLFSSTCMSSAIATVAPDSFENDQCEVKECSQAGQVQGAVKTDQSTLGAGATLDAKTTSAVGFKHPVYRRKRGATKIGGSDNASSKLVVDHVAQKGISGLKVGDGDANVSSMPVCRDPRGDLVSEPCSTSNLSAIDSQIDKTGPDKQIHRHETDRNLSGSNSTSFVITTVLPPQDDAFSPDYRITSDVYGASRKCEVPSQASDYSELLEILDNVETKMAHNGEGVKDILRSDILTKMAPNDELENIFELVGSYMHPMPISMVMLRTKGNEVYICVLCGYLMEKDRKLLIYKASIKGENRGCPSFIGHTTIISPISNNASSRQKLLDSSSLQFTPDGKCLVLLNNIKASYCREGSVDCQCSVCTSDSFEKNAVKVVQVKLGYVQVVCKLKTTNDVGSILVCEPSYLVAAEEGGRMNLWIMNSQWSAPIDKCYLPTSDSKSNCIVGLKRIPNFPDLIVGHSAFGDFYLWDLRRRIIVSKFSAPGSSYQPFLPINLYRFPSQTFSTRGACTKRTVADIMEETRKFSLEAVKEDDLSLVLLMPSVSNLDLFNKHPHKDSGVSSVGCWSLALLAKSKLVSENALDPSATIAGASAGYGIIGTSDGSLYIWELATGTKLGYLSNCKGATMSCLTADDSDSGAFAVAVDGSQLQVYAPGTSANRKHA